MVNCCNRGHVGSWYVGAWRWSQSLGNARSGCITSHNIATQTSLACSCSCLLFLTDLDGSLHHVTCTQRSLRINFLPLTSVFRSVNFVTEFQVGPAYGQSEFQVNTVLWKLHVDLSCGNLPVEFEICSIQRIFTWHSFFEFSGRYLCVVTEI